MLIKHFKNIFDKVILFHFILVRLSKPTYDRIFTYGDHFIKFCELVFQGYIGWEFKN